MKMKKRTYILPVLLMIMSIWAQAQTANYTWAQHFGKAGGTSSTGTDLLATDRAGNVYVSGNYGGTGITFGTTNISGTGGINGFIAKLDPNGNPIWAKSTHEIQAGWDGDGNPDKIAIDSSGNVYLCGFFQTGATLNNVPLTGNNNYFLAKLDPMGNVSWIRTTTIQEIYKSLNAIHIDAQQHICMTGLFQNTIGFGQGFTLTNVSNPAGVDAFLTKYDSGGNIISAKELGVINPVWSNQNYPFEQFQYDNEDNLYRFVKQNAVLAKYDASGNLMNTDTISATSGTLAIRSFAVDKDKSILFSGSFTNGPLIMGSDTIYNNVNNTDYDAIVLKLNTANSLLWCYQFPTNQSTNYYTMVRTDDIGNVYALGREGSSLGISRIPVTKLTRNGDLIWNNFITNTNPPHFTIWGYQFQQNTIVPARNGGNVLVLGGFNGNSNPNAPSQGYIFFDSLLNFTIPATPQRGDIFIAQLGTCNTANPVITSSVNAFCEGDSVLVSTSSAPHWLWSTNDTTSNISVKDSATYFMYAVESSGCFAKSNELHFTLYPTSSDTIIATDCDSYTFNGQLFTSSGIYRDTLINTNGCDSIVTLHLTLNTVNTGTTQNGATLTATNAAGGVTYQWINCNSGVLIPGATNQSYTATSNGSYAVIITKADCRDTSVCINVATAGTQESEVQGQIILYPNPVSNQLKIDIGNIGDLIINNIKIVNTLSQIVLEQKSNVQWVNVSALVGGIYFITIETNKGSYTGKFLKQ